jgi:hypothetical protein
MSAAPFHVHHIASQIGHRCGVHGLAGITTSLGITQAQLYRKDLGLRYVVQAPNTGLTLTLDYLGEQTLNFDESNWGLAQASLVATTQNNRTAWQQAWWGNLNPMQFTFEDAKRIFGQDFRARDADASFFSQSPDGRSLVIAFEWDDMVGSSSRLKSASLSHLGGYIKSAKSSTSL